MFLFDLIFLQRQSRAAAPAAAEKKKTPSRRSFPAGRETGEGAEETPPAGPERRSDQLPREEPSPWKSVLPQEDPFRGEDGEAFSPAEGRRESPDSGRMAARLDAIAECTAKQVRFLRKMTGLMRSQADGTYYL